MNTNTSSIIINHQHSSTALIKIVIMNSDRKKVKTNKKNDAIKVVKEKTRTARKTNKPGGALDAVMNDVCAIVTNKQNGIIKKMKTRHAGAQKAIAFFDKNKDKKDAKFLTSKKAIEYRKKLVFLSSKEVEFSLEDFAALKKAMKDKDTLGFMKLSVALFIKYDVSYHHYPLAIEWDKESRKNLISYNLTFIETIIIEALNEESSAMETQLQGEIETLTHRYDLDWPEKWMIYLEDTKPDLEREEGRFKLDLQLHGSTLDSEEVQEIHVDIKKTIESKDRLLHKVMGVILDLKTNDGKKCLKLIKENFRDEDADSVLVRIFFYNAIQDLRPSENVVGKFGDIFTLYLDASVEGKAARKKTKGPGHLQISCCCIKLLSKVGKAEITALHKTCKELSLL